MGGAGVDDDGCHVATGNRRTIDNEGDLITRFNTMTMLRTIGQKKRWGGAGGGGWGDTEHNITHDAKS